MQRDNHYIFPCRLYTAGGIPRFQRVVKTPVAVTAVGTMIIEWSVQAEPSTAFQQFAGTGEQALYCRPVHNVCGVGAEQPIVAFLGCVLWP